MRDRRAFLVLAGLICIRGFAGGGVNMTSGLFLTPVSQELGVGVGTLSLYLSVMSVVTVLWLPIAGKLINRYPVRLLAPAAAALQGLSFAAYGLQNHVIGWYLLAIPQAMGTAILVNLLGPVLLNRWFPRNTGAVLGLLMSFVWLFAAVFQPTASWLMEAEGWRLAYVTIGLTAFVVEVTASLLLLRDRPAASEETGTEQASPAKEDAYAVEIPERTAVHSASFILLLIFMLAMTGTAVFTQHIPTYGGLLGYSLTQVGAAMSLSSIGSALGAVAIGLICDRVGGLRTCLGIIGLWMVGVLGFLFGGSGFAVFAASAFLHGAASSGIAVLAPILTMTFYGKKDYEKIYAKVAMGAPLASILLVPAYGFLYDATDSYFSVLIMLLGFLCAAGLSIQWGWRKRCTAAGCPVWHIRGRSYFKRT